VRKLFGVLAVELGLPRAGLVLAPLLQVRLELRLDLQVHLALPLVLLLEGLAVQVVSAADSCSTAAEAVVLLLRLVAVVEEVVKLVGPLPALYAYVAGVSPRFCLDNGGTKYNRHCLKCLALS